MPIEPGVQNIITVLKQQLTALDRLGAHIAAAHVDAAIQQLKLECARREQRQL